MHSYDKDFENVVMDEVVADGGLREDDGKIQADSQGYETNVETLPKGYYYSPFFIGTLCAVGLGFWAGLSGFAYAAPLLSTINADLGPDPNIQWVALGKCRIIVKIGLEL
jgi:hypothetical protein